MNKITWIALLSLLLLAGCIGKPPTKPAIPPDESSQVDVILERFFDALHEGDYQAAVDLYGGSYEILIEMNPDLEPGAHLALLERACKTNGFQCLRVGEVLAVDETSQGVFDLTVTFLTAAGETFQRGPCCGAGAGDEPPHTDFTFRVAREGTGQYMVLDLPPYAP